MAAIAVAHDHLFHGNISLLLPHHHHIKQRPPPPTSRCACAFSSPTTSHHQHHLHHRSTSQLPTSPKRIPSISSSSADSRSVAGSPSSPSKTKKTPSSSKTSATSRAHFQELLSRSLGAGDYDKAFHCLQRLVSAGYRPKVVPCTKLIKGLSSTTTTSSSSDSLRRAKWIMEILELHGSPDTVAYTAFLDALCRFNQVDTALSFLPRMRRRLCPPNNITYNVLIRELCLRGRHDDALDLFRRMLEDDLSQPCVVTYTILIEAHISVGAVAEAVRLLEDMLSRGLSLDSHTYRAIIRGLCREGLVDEAWQLVRQQKSSGSDPESGFPTVGSYNILLKGLLGKKRWRDAGVLVEEMFADGHLEPDVLTCSSLVLSFCQEGMVENALSFLDDMVLWGLRPNSQCIDPVINACCKQGMVGLAMASVERMVAAGCVLDIVNYNKILGALCKSGKARDAARLLWELQRTGCEPNTSSYNAVVGGLWAEGERQMAVELVGNMLEKGLVADEVTYNMLVTCLCRDGMVDKAMDLVGIMEVAGLSPTATTYNSVLLTLCEEGRLVEAIDVFVCKMMRRMGTSSRRKSGGNADTGRITRPRDSTYEILVEGIAFGGHTAEVAELVNVLITSNVISENSKRRIRMRTGHWHQQEEEQWR